MVRRTRPSLLHGEAKATATSAEDDELKQPSTRRDGASGPELAGNEDDSAIDGAGPQGFGPGARAKKAQSVAQVKAERLGNLFVAVAAVALLLAIGTRWAMGRTADSATSPVASAPAIATAPPRVAPPRKLPTRLTEAPAVAPRAAASAPTPGTATARAIARPPAEEPAPAKGKPGDKKPTPYVPDDI